MSDSRVIMRNDTVGSGNVSKISIEAKKAKTLAEKKGNNDIN